MPLEFTPEQLAIFDFVSKGSGHGTIDAVAGAGKTTTIMESASYVPQNNDMLFCAFNKSIASEIEAKFNETGMNRITVKTIHALGYNILKQHSTTGEKPLLSENKFKDILKQPDFQNEVEESYLHIYKINRLDPNNLDDRSNVNAIRSLKFLIDSRLVDICQKFRATLCKNTPEDFFNLVTHFGIFSSIDQAKSNFKEEVEEYFHIHDILLKRGIDISQKSMLIDFTDMLFLPYIWQKYPNEKYDFVFIDECQDLSKSQFAIALKYCKKTCRILSVGDPYQSIYGFTGADVQSFERVRVQTKAKQLPLTVCFRCPKQMITLAKDIRPDISGAKEYNGIIKSINFNEVIDLAKPNDLIICRVKAPLLILVFKFVDKGIRVKIHQDEATEFINELKYLFKQDERRTSIPNLNNGFDTIKDAVRSREEYKIEKNAERIVDPTERQLIIRKEKDFLNEKLEFIHKKYIQWSNNCFTVEDILVKFWKYITADENPIRLSSIHRAKGLEENRVFILEYDKLPFVRLEMPEWQKVQELNLKYVAVTRAKKELYLVKEEQLSNAVDEGNLFDDIFNLLD